MLVQHPLYHRIRRRLARQPIREVQSRAQQQRHLSTKRPSAPSPSPATPPAHLPPNSLPHLDLSIERLPIVTSLAHLNLPHLLLQPLQRPPKLAQISTLLPTLLEVIRLRLPDRSRLLRQEGLVLCVPGCERRDVGVESVQEGNLKGAVEGITLRSIVSAVTERRGRGDARGRRTSSRSCTATPTPREVAPHSLQPPSRAHTLPKLLRKQSSLRPILRERRRAVERGRGRTGAHG